MTEMIETGVRMKGVHRVHLEKPDCVSIAPSQTEVEETVESHEHILLRPLTDPDGLCLSWSPRNWKGGSWQVSLAMYRMALRSWLD